MNRIDFRCKEANWRALTVLCLLLLALVLRALVPVGYMPHTSALRDGRIEITFCFATDNSTAIPSTLAGLFADSDEHKKNALSGSDCPFGMLIHQALNAPEPTTLAALQPPTRSRPAAFVDYKAMPSLGAQGPPVGSRAPPLLLV